MGKRWIEFKRAVRRPFNSGPAPRSAVEQEARTAGAHRRQRLRLRIAAIDRDLLGLARAIAAERDLQGATAAAVIRRGLVRARDLRHKASLLEAELDRESAEAGPAAGTGDQPASRPADVPRAVQRAAKRALTAAEFERRSQRSVFERALKDLLGPSPRRRLGAVASLRRLRSPKTVLLLKAALDFDDDLVRIESLEALADLGTPCTLDEISGLLVSHNHLLRLAALRTLSRIATADAVPTCIGCLTDKSAEVRRTAARMLGLIGARTAATALAILLRDEAAEVRAAAAETLGLLGSEQVIHALIRTLCDEETAVRSTAKTALERTLRASLDLDVDQDPAALLSRVDALSSWWIDARVSGEPWPAPGSIEHGEGSKRDEGREVVPLFIRRGASRRADHAADDRRKADHGSS